MDIHKILNKKQLGLVGLILTLSACMVGPHYVPLKVTVPPSFKEAQGKPVIGTLLTNWNIINPQDACDRGEWWLVFNDPVLNKLETQLNHYNQNIAIAEAVYRQSLAIVDEARASLYPNLIGAFNLFRQRQAGGATAFVSSSGATNTASSGIARNPSTLTTYTSVLSSAWEPDIWGAVRRTIEADRSAAQSNAALVGVTRLSAQASLAQYYFELRALDNNQVYLERAVDAYKKILKLTKNQYASGVVSQINSVLVQIQLRSAQTTAVNNGILRAQYEHAIAVLTGHPPANFVLKTKKVTMTPPAIPLEVPTVWLERRPDVAAAERLVQQASALIGVTEAAYYPNLVLTATTTAAGKSFHNLINTPSVGWSGGVEASEIIIDGGLRSATMRAAKANYEAQIATYRQTVLTAFQEVEDNLVALRLLEEQMRMQNKQVADARLALRLSSNQYRAGIIDYSSVVTTELSALTAELTASQVQGLQMVAAAGLVKSLGGGWLSPEILITRTKTNAESSVYLRHP